MVYNYFNGLLLGSIKFKLRSIYIWICINILAIINDLLRKKYGSHSNVG